VINNNKPFQKPNYTLLNIVYGINRSTKSDKSLVAFWCQAPIKSSLFSAQKKTNTGIFIDPEPYPLSPGQTYVAYGEYYYGKTGYTNFRILPFSSAIQEILGESVSPIASVTRLENGYEYDPAYDLLAEKLRVTSNSLVVNATSDILALLPFQQQKSLITSGRAFTDDEYNEQKNVCIIRELAARRMDKRVGDTVSLSIVEPNGAALLDSYKPATGFIRWNSAACTARGSAIVSVS